MNILFLDQFGDLGGAQQCLLELMPAIRRQGWRSFAAVPAEGGLADRLRDLGVAVEPFRIGDYSRGGKNGLDWIRYAARLPLLVRQLRQLLKAHAIDLLYVNGPRALPVAALACGRRLPLVFHAHNSVSGAARRMVHASLDWCDRPSVIAVSRYVALYLDGRASEVVPNGAEDLALPRRSTERGSIGVVGRIAAEKGLLEFVEAVRLLPRDWKFLVAGTASDQGHAYEEAVRARAAGLPIEFQGWRGDRAQLFSELGLLVVPSGEREGFGRVIIEAFSAGVPVVAHDSGGIGELIDDGESGYLTGDQSSEALAARIREAWEDTEGLRARITAEARARWEREYTLERYQERITRVIAAAASRASTAATSSVGR